MDLLLLGTVAILGPAVQAPPITQAEARACIEDATGVDLADWECRSSIEGTPCPQYEFTQVDADGVRAGYRVSAVSGRLLGYTRAGDPVASDTKEVGPGDAVSIAVEAARPLLSDDELASLKWPDEAIKWRDGDDHWHVNTIRREVGDPPRQGLTIECDAAVRISDGAVTDLRLYVPMNTHAIPAKISAAEAVRLAREACPEESATTAREPYLMQVQEIGQEDLLQWRVTLSADGQGRRFLRQEVGDDGTVYDVYLDGDRPEFTYTVDAVSGAIVAGGAAASESAQPVLPSGVPSTDPEPAGMQPLIIAGIGLGVIALLALGALVWRRRSGS
jgi:uncharacterized membrane protein YkoI